MSTAAPLDTKLRSQSVRANLTTFGTGIFRSTGGRVWSDMTGRGGGGVGSAPSIGGASGIRSDRGTSPGRLRPPVTSSPHPPYPAIYDRGPVVRSR